MNERQHNFDRQINRGIQFLRILACLAVFICHFGQRLHLDKWSTNLYNFTQLGRYGVELFFVISGYLVCYSLSKNSSVLQFYKKRAIRILPLYYFCILYYFITETFIFRDVPTDSNGLGWLRYIFCLNGIVPSEGYFWSNIGITWTIPVFVLFYLIAPFLVKICRNVLSSSICLLVSIGLAILIKRELSGWLSGFLYLPCFMFGIVVFHAKKANKQFWTILGFQLFVFFLKWGEWQGHLLKITRYCDLYTVSSIFAAIVLLSNQIVVNKERITKVFDVLDEHSYTLYLVHGIVFCGILDKFHFNTWIRLFIAIVVTSLLTIAIHKFIEKPIQNKLSAFSLRNRNNKRY